MTIDCLGDCSPAVWIGDGECDTWFNCGDLLWDGGDCPIPSKWTVLIYMMADNNLEGNTLTEFTELMGIGAGDDVKVILQVDWAEGAPSWVPTWWRMDDKTAIERWEIGDGTYEILDYQDETDASADPWMLSDFISWGLNEYPAERTALVLWNHGGGFTYGGDDFPSEQDYFSLPSIAQSIDAGLAGTAENQFDILVFYACLMSSLETAAYMSPYAEWMVGSEESHYGLGYSGLAAAVDDPDMDGNAVGSAWISGFPEKYDSPSLQSKKHNMTISLLDLSMVPALLEQFEELSSILAQNMAQEWLALGTARTKTLGFSKPVNCPSGRMVDLSLLLGYLETYSEDPLVAEYATTVLALLQDVVVSEWHGDSQLGAGGMTIHFPAKLDCYSSSYNLLDPSLGNWIAALGEYYEQLATDSVPPILESGEVDIQDGVLLLTGVMDPTTLWDLASLRFEYSEFVNHDSTEGGILWSLGGTNIEVEPDTGQFEVTYEMDEILLSSTGECDFGVTCNWAHYLDRKQTALGEYFDVPLEYHYDDYGVPAKAYVSWQPTYQQNPWMKVGEGFVYHGDGVVSELLPEAGSVFQPFVLQKEQGLAYDWQSLPGVQFDATGDLHIVTSSVSPGTPMVYRFRASDLAGNNTVGYACSGASGMYFVEIDIVTEDSWDGLGNAADFMVEISQNGIQVKNTSAVSDHDTAYFSFMLGYDSDVMSLKILEEDTWFDDLVWDDATVLNDLFLESAIEGTAFHFGNYSDGSGSADVSVSVVRCLEY